MAAKRELIEPRKGDERYVRRNKKGTIQVERRCRPLTRPGPAPQGKERGTAARVTAVTGRARWTALDPDPASSEIDIWQWIRERTQVGLGSDGMGRAGW